VVPVPTIPIIAVIIVVTSVMIVPVAGFQSAASANASEFPPAVVRITAAGTPTVTRPVTGVVITAMAVVIVVHVSVAVTSTALQDGAG